MARRPHISVLLPASAAVALSLLHVFGLGPQPVGAESATDVRPVKTRTQVDPFAGRELDEAKRQAFKDRFMPSVLDVGPERAEKEFYKQMKVLGSSPVEIVAEPGSGLGLIVGEDASGFAEFLREGGHYSGRLPAELTPKGEKQK